MEKKILINLLLLAERLKEDIKEDFVKQGKQSKEFQSASKKEKVKVSLPARNMLSVLLDEGRMNQRKLSAKVGVSPQTASEIIKKLEMKALVIKTNGENNNEKILTLTEKGERKAQRYNQFMEELGNKKLQRLTKEETVVLVELLNKLLGE